MPISWAPDPFVDERQAQLLQHAKYKGPHDTSAENGGTMKRRF